MHIITYQATIPEWTEQFATFNENSYGGNPFLFRLSFPICNENGPLTTVLQSSTSIGEDDNLIDTDNFFITFTTSYVIVIFRIVVALYTNPYWRCKWFIFFEI